MMMGSSATSNFSEFKLAFKPGDVIYGFKDDVAMYLAEVKSAHQPDIKFFTQSHINKPLIHPISGHSCTLRPPAVKPSQPNYGSITGATEQHSLDQHKPQEFATYLSQHYSKHKLADRDTKACTFFKRLCKQGIQFARHNNHKVHFTLDTIFSNDEAHLVIVQKNRHSKYYCRGCHLDSVTGSELRSIYRDWTNLQNTVVFWYQGRRTQPPWVMYAAFWQKYDKIRGKRAAAMARRRRRHHKKRHQQSSGVDKDNYVSL